MGGKRQKAAAKSARDTPYVLHAAQLALANRCEQTPGAIVGVEGGGGKTGVARAYVDSVKPRVCVFVSPSVEHARKKAREVGADFAGPFASSQLGPIGQKLSKGEAVRVMSTQQFWKRELADVPRLVRTLFATLGDVDVLLVLDEADKWYQASKYAHRLRALREAVPRVRVLLLTASPGLEPGTKSAANRRQWAEAILGAEPARVRYSCIYPVVVSLVVVLPGR